MGASNGIRHRGAKVMEFLPILTILWLFIKSAWKAMEGTGIDRVIHAFVIMVGVFVWSVIILLIEGMWYVIHKIWGRKKQC